MRKVFSYIFILLFFVFLAFALPNFMFPRSVNQWLKINRAQFEIQTFLSTGRKVFHGTGNHADHFYLGYRCLRILTGSTDSVDSFEIYPRSCPRQGNKPILMVSNERTLWKQITGRINYNTNMMKNQNLPGYERAVKKLSSHITSFYCRESGAELVSLVIENKFNAIKPEENRDFVLFTTAFRFDCKNQKELDSFFSHIREEAAAKLTDWPEFRFLLENKNKDG